MDVLILLAMLAALFSLGASVVAVTAASEARRESRRLARDRDLINRVSVYQHPRSIR